MAPDLSRLQGLESRKQGLIDMRNELLALLDDVEELSGQAKSLFDSSRKFQTVLGSDRARSTTNIMAVGDFSTLSEAFDDLSTRQHITEKIVEVGRRFHAAAMEVHEKSTLGPQERQASMRLLKKLESHLDRLGGVKRR